MWLDEFWWIESMLGQSRIEIYIIVFGQLCTKLTIVGRTDWTDAIADALCRASCGGNRTAGVGSTRLWWYSSGVASWKSYELVEKDSCFSDWNFSQNVWRILMPSASSTGNLSKKNLENVICTLLIWKDFKLEKLHLLCNWAAILYRFIFYFWPYLLGIRSGCFIILGLRNKGQVLSQFLVCLIRILKFVILYGSKMIFDNLHGH